MPGFPRSTKFTSLLNALGEVERERFWHATGIDVNGRTVDKEKFNSFKNGLADYQAFLSRSGGIKPVVVETAPKTVCESCGLSDENEIYVIVPKCIRFCVRCTEELIRDVERVQ